MTIPPPFSISSAYASKFGLSAGDSITLKEKYEDKTYTITVTQLYPYEASLGVFLSRDHLNDGFDLGKDMYGGYFSSSDICCSCLSGVLFFV